MSQVLKFSDKDLKTSVIKMLQQPVMNSPETKKKKH